jgi:hypothetical protein
LIKRCHCMYFWIYTVMFKELWSRRESLFMLFIMEQVTCILFIPVLSACETFLFGMGYVNQKKLS